MIIDNYGVFDIFKKEDVFVSNDTYSAYWTTDPDWITQGEEMFEYLTGTNVTAVLAKDGDVTNVISIGHLVGFTLTIRAYDIKHADEITLDNAEMFITLTWEDVKHKDIFDAFSAPLFRCREEVLEKAISAFREKEGN